MGKMWGEVRRKAISVLSSLVLVHNLVQAIPWLIALVISVGSGVYGAAEQQHVVLAISAGVIAGASLTLLIGFFAWYLQRRRDGYRQKAAEAAKDRERIEEELGEQRLAQERVDRMALALKLINDLNLNSLEILNSRDRIPATRDWLASHLVPAMLKISPHAGVALLQWEKVEGRKGEYRLQFDAGVPEIIRSVLPKRSNREFGTCLAMLQVKNFHPAFLTQGMADPVMEWLVAFPEREFDLAANAVFSTGARIISDAWRGLGQEPAPVPA